ncbi:hypothetical protein RFI_01264 [Reticulomyxa filosa]|uniref:Uncharacterized protein n=1 Tax=Reticulomyxa filosa TaxID=46433 RepID=X6PCJ8_RETFI|nr:hypothetical protein RFI_01264 [Reticulomyxa filosa]|eukprot:ETO35799.1 hypothetical protein RFI_01264 [Reticulomyxa filosa]
MLNQTTSKNDKWSEVCQELNLWLNSKNLQDIKHFLLPAQSNGWNQELTRQCLQWQSKIDQITVRLQQLRKDIPQSTTTYQIQFQSKSPVPLPRVIYCKQITYPLQKHTMLFAVRESQVPITKSPANWTKDSNKALNGSSTKNATEVSQSHEEHDSSEDEREEKEFVLTKQPKETNGQMWRSKVASDPTNEKKGDYDDRSQNDDHVQTYNNNNNNNNNTNNNDNYNYNNNNNNNGHHEDTESTVTGDYTPFSRPGVNPFLPKVRTKRASTDGYRDVLKRFSRHCEEVMDDVLQEAILDKSEQPDPNPIAVENFIEEKKENS